MALSCGRTHAVHYIFVTVTGPTDILQRVLMALPGGFLGFTRAANSGLKLETATFTRVSNLSALSVTDLLFRVRVNLIRVVLRKRRFCSKSLGRRSWTSLCDHIAAHKRACVAEQQVGRHLSRDLQWRPLLLQQCPCTSCVFSKAHLAVSRD